MLIYGAKNHRKTETFQSGTAGLVSRYLCETKGVQTLQLTTMHVRIEDRVCTGALPLPRLTQGEYLE